MQWSLDQAHSTVAFAVRHMGISTVRGRFHRVTGAVESSDDGILKSIEASIDAESIDTAEPRRDTHLRSSDFLNAAEYPYVTFRSTAVRPLSQGRYLVEGDLTIRDEARPVRLEVDVTETVADGFGFLRAGATVSGVLNRNDWGLTWNQLLEFGALLVGEEVRFTLDVEAITPVSAQAVAS